MSALTIRSGSVVEVDTASLRRVAGALAALEREAGEIVARAASIVDRASRAQPWAFAAVLEATMLRAAVEHAERELAEIAEGLRSAAALYEAVELHVARDAAAAAGDAALVSRLDVRLHRLALTHPSAVAEGRRALDGAPSGHDDLYRQAFLGSTMFGGGPLWLAFPYVFGAADLVGLGRIPAGYPLAAGADTAVRVRPVATADAAPPTSLAAAVQRIPSGGEAQVRVERYAMPDGTRQFGVYVAGTRTGGGDTQPFDNRSNLALYAGERSASYTAVTNALAEAGAREGDVVHGFGHSQGAMVLERLALEGTYDTRTLVSLGSPVQADVGAETLAVSLRHTDDPVAALQSGGHVGVVGAPDSFVVERLADPVPGFRDLEVPAHSLTAYTDTASMVDTSADPRADALREALHEWSEAVSGEAIDYAAERVSPGALDAGAG